MNQILQHVPESPLQRAHAAGQSGWCVCACGWTELVINELWRMVRMWPGLKCPNCKTGYLMPPGRERG